MSEKFSWTLAIVYLNIVLYATCFQIQRPLEPYMVDKLNLNSGGDSANEYAKLQSFFSIVQTVGSFVTGIVLDRLGAKFGFYVNFLASAASYYLLSQATTLNILYLSKIPTVFQAGYLCAQLTSSQVTSDGPERAQALGRVSMAYSVGSVIGPALGGWLGATGDYYFAAKLSIAGSLLSVVLTAFMPNTIAVKSKKETVDDEKPTAQNSNFLSSTIKVISVVWLYLGTKVISSVANAMNAAALPMILKNTYGFTEAQMGLAMSGSSALNAIVNGLLLGSLLKLLGGDLGTVIGTCLFMMAALSALQAGLAYPAVVDLSFSGGVVEFMGTTLALSIFQYVLASTITSESTSIVDPQSKGTLLGLEHSLFALARVFAPQMGITAWKTGGVSLVAGSCAGIFSFVLAVWQVSRGDKAAKYPPGAVGASATG